MGAVEHLVHQRNQSRLNSDNVRFPGLLRHSMCRMCFAYAQRLPSFSWGLAYLLASVFVLYINRFLVVPEDRVLSTKFGTEFFACKARVRRWL